jgi:SAM-dependent methyltransferase
MSNESSTQRASFRNCDVFTAERSLRSIIDACEFETEGKESLLHVLDAFSGHGIVADAVSKYLSTQGIPHHVSVADINQKHLEKVDDRYTKLCCDLRKDAIGEKYGLIVLRYGLHDLPMREKQAAIENLNKSLDNGGRIVISDIMPDGQSRMWLEQHHQQKEILTKGPNQNVYLAPPDEYLRLLHENGMRAEVKDSFYQEVFMREWVGTFGTAPEVVSALEELTLQAPQELRDRFMIFNHPKKGARIYFPIVTLAGVKNAGHHSY